MCSSTASQPFSVKPIDGHTSVSSRADTQGNCSGMVYGRPLWLTSSLGLLTIGGTGRPPERLRSALHPTKRLRARSAPLPCHFLICLPFSLPGGLCRLLKPPPLPSLALGPPGDQNPHPCRHVGPQPAQERPHGLQ